MTITSAAGILSLLDESEDDLKVFAIKKLNNIVNEFWPEISDAIIKIEILNEDVNFKERELAALVASKVYYHLGAYNDSLSYALSAGSLFDISSSSEYVDTIIAKCIEFYISQRTAVNDGNGDFLKIDPRLESVVNQMFQRCFDHKQYKQALGIALETKRMDMFEKAIVESDDVVGMLTYAFKIAMSLVDVFNFRNKVLRSLVGLYQNLKIPDYINMCQCLIFLDDPLVVAEIIEKLLRDDEDSMLMAYQIAFDLYESATQQFLSKIMKALRKTGHMSSSVNSVTENIAVEDAVNDDTSLSQVPKEEIKINEKEKKHLENMEKLNNVLSGSVTISLHLQFLIRNNKTDMLILKSTKDSVRVSVCHTATIIANGFMHSGTTSDQFLRDNLDWLARATNWAKFSATASLGVIHRGHEKEALQLMQSYLPRDSSSSAGYSEGGALYALGLIHANHGNSIIEYLMNQLKDAQNEIIRHGACLGLGLAAIGTHQHDVYEQLKFNLYQDDAITGQAAGIAMGLVMLCSRSTQAVEDMVAYAQETQHEKILCGLAIGIALIMFGSSEEADSLITNLCQDKDPILRRSGMYTLAMAYCGTGNNLAVKKLLHMAVSDVNDDVRRAAVEALGFLLFKTPEQCPSIVSLLSESYNPHVRYGAAMALGIACAGTGLKEAISLLEPMINDPVSYVRQGALLASAIVLVQQTEHLCPKVKEFRAIYAKVISDKHEDVMAKFGAIVAQGIIDAGGRNVTISLQSKTGHTNMISVVGMLVFTQFWFWFPLSHFLSLSFDPTCIIGLNADLQMPKIQFRSNAKPSLFAYPPPSEEKKKEEREKVTTAVLSITAKAKKREAEKHKEEQMDVDFKETEKKTKDEKSDIRKESELGYDILSNPARVMKQQLKHIMLLEESRYMTVKDISVGGIIMLKYLQNLYPEELVEPVIPLGIKSTEEEGPEPEPPEPFEYTED